MVEFASGMIEIDSTIYFRKKSEQFYDRYICLSNATKELKQLQDVTSRQLIEKLLLKFIDGGLKEEFSMEYWLRDLDQSPFKLEERFISINKNCLVTYDKQKSDFNFYDSSLSLIQSSKLLFPSYIERRDAAITFSKDTLYYALPNKLVKVPGQFRNGCVEDLEGNLYILAADGIYQISNFNVYSHKEKLQDFQTAFASHEEIYIANSLEIYALFAGKKISMPKSNIMGVDLMIRKIIQLKPSELIICTNVGEFIYHVNTHVLSKTKYILKYDSITHEYWPNKSLFKINQKEYLASSSSMTYFISLEPAKKIVPIRQGRAYSLFLSSSDFLYISTLDGLQRAKFDRTQLDKLVFSSVPLGSKSCFVNALEEDQNKNIILSTNVGLKFMHFNQLYDYPDLIDQECIKTIIDPRDQTLWTATSQGLYHIKYNLSSTPKFEMINHYLDIDGMPSNELRDIELQGDTLVVLSSNGYAFLDTKLPTNDQYTLPIFLDAVFKNDSLCKDIHTFQYSDLNIQFSFSCPYFKRNSRLVFQYVLEGSNKVEVSKEEDFISFFSLQPGNYLLKVRAIDIDHQGIKSQWISVKFEVEPPFWATWWFRVLLFSLGFLAIYFVVRWYIRREKIKLQKEQEIFNKISSFELKSLRAQMNPHFIFNCLNSIKDYLYKKDFESTAKYLSKFASLVRKSLNMSRSNYASIDEEIAFLDTYCLLEQMRFSMQFDYVITNINLPEDYELPTLMIQPFVENAIRHGQIGNLPYKGTLRIQFELQGEELCCIIEDNGIGYEQGLKNKKSKINEEESKSLNIFEERISLYKMVYHLNIEMQILDKTIREEKGTLVTIVLKPSDKA